MQEYNYLQCKRQAKREFENLFKVYWTGQRINNYKLFK